MKLSKNKFSSFISHFSSRRGFTLIELLIVIAILGILAAGVLVAINPVKRINQARDSTIKSDIAQIATAMQTYYTARGTEDTAYYPSTVQALVDADELKSLPANGEVAANFPTGCTGTACTEVAVSAVLNEPATVGNVWCWRSDTGLAAEMTVTACTAAPTP